MADHDVLKKQEVLEEGCKRRVQTPEVWFLQISSSDTIQVEFSWGKRIESQEIKADGLLLLDRVDVRVIKGTLLFRQLHLEVLRKLLGFIDESRNVNSFDANTSRWTSIPLQNTTMMQNRKFFEYWFLQEMWDPSPEFKMLLALLRHNESYLLVRFLLGHTTYYNTLQELGDRYGVSYSHFRRLCSHALGNGAKAELRDWRMARSLLDVAEGQDNLTEVAFKHGYSSSSHFSNDIKELLGVSPSGFSNIIQLATK